MFPPAAAAARRPPLRSALPVRWHLPSPALITACLLLLLCTLLALSAHLGVFRHAPLAEPLEEAAAQQLGAPADALGASVEGVAAAAGPSSAAPWDRPEPQLTQEELHGGWQLTWEVFDRATKHPNATVLSWNSPRAVLISDFVSPSEINHMLRAAGQLERSEVVSDEGTQQEVRTSSGAWLNGEKRDAKIVEIQQRISRLVGIPEAFGESIYVLRYELGQEYLMHNDHCSEIPGEPPSQSCREFLQRAGGPGCGPGAGGVTCGDRLLTMIMYLRSPKRGGATAFPHAVSAPAAAPLLGQRAALQQGGDADGGDGAASVRRVALQEGGSEPGVNVPLHCQEGSGALQTSPPPGSALLFWDFVPAGPGWQPGDIAAPDPSSAHCGCPVLEGTKLIATRWMRAAEFR